MSDATLADVKSWLENLGRFAPNHLEIRSNTVEELHVVIYTDNNSYSIVAKPPHPPSKPSKSTSYLGCIASSRKPRAGEDHTRGRDLPDGQLNYATWFRILEGIVSFELVKVHTK